MLVRKACLIRKAFHGSMDPRIHGSRDPGIHGSLDPWIYGSMDPWIHGSLDPWIRDPGIHGSRDPGIRSGPGSYRFRFQSVPVPTGSGSFRFRFQDLSLLPSSGSSSSCSKMISTKCLRNRFRFPVPGSVRKFHDETKNAGTFLIFLN